MINRREKFIGFMENDFPIGAYNRDKLIGFVKEQPKIFDFNSLIGALERKVTVFTHFPEEKDSVGDYRDMLTAINQYAGASKPRMGFHVSGNLYFQHDEDE